MRALSTGALSAVALLFALFSGSAAQDGFLTGRAWSEDGSLIEDARARVFPVADSTRVQFTETDRLGYFFFRDLAPGSYVLAITRIGYAEYRERVEITVGGSTDIEALLVRRAVQLEGFVIEGERSRARVRFEESAGITVQDLSREELKSIPGIAESDPLRAVEVLPGVTTVSDFSSAFNVRGGSGDQNLILLDDVPIYNPFHLGNIFSVFNADMVGRAELRAGGFPAEYGGRVSSVLTIETDADDGVTSVDAGVSVLASRAAVGGSLPTGVNDALGLANTRWRVSGRRSYFDVLLKPWTDFPYHLTDLQGIFEAWTKGGNRIRFTGYSGRDVIDLSDIDDTPLGLRWSWGNDAVGGSWTNPMRGGGSLAVRASFSRFESDFGFTDLETDFGTRIQRASVQADMERRPTLRIRWKSGIAASWREYDNIVEAAGTRLDADAGSGVELALYSQIHWEPADRWLVEPGLRLDHWRPHQGEVTTTLSPRFAVKRFVRDGNSALRLSAGRYTQFIHSLRDEEFPFGLDIWVLAGIQAPRVVSDQIQIGLESFLDEEEGWFASLEGYYRTFDGVIALNAVDDPNDLLDDFVAGDGESYGVDFFVRRHVGASTGWISVSLLKTDRTFPETRVGIQPLPVVTYPPVFDRRLDVDLVLRRELGRWGLEGGVRANFGSGLPYTRPLGTYRVFNRRLVEGRLEYDNDSAVVLGPRNGERFPARHRLDLSLRKTVEKDWGTITPYLNVINVYNRKNVLFYFFDYETDPPRRSGVSMIPILPTVGVEVSF